MPLFFIGNAEAPVYHRHNVGTRLFIGNVSVDTTEQSLRSVFDRDRWEISDVVIVTDRQTGRSRGFGFVEFAREGEAQEAREALEGVELDGRRLAFREAHQRPLKS